MTKLTIQYYTTDPFTELDKFTYDLPTRDIAIDFLESAHEMEKSEFGEFWIGQGYVIGEFKIGVVE